ncbi:MAG: prolyl oligopeptidase family serine peptidase [Kiritimatiellaeota bacterium]|nr:prolyl oligopeptidase family serine peptidase [Kiritimatiellota bacterium]
MNEKIINRNLSPQAMFAVLADKHIPTRSFSGSDFTKWKRETWPEVLATLGDWPERVDPNPVMSAEWEHDGLVKQRWFIDVGYGISAVLQINRGKDIDEKNEHPAILCCHGHGQFGKEPVMGNDSTPELRGAIERMNYNYGHVMAKKGFVTYAIDWIGFGERADKNKPNWNSAGAGRDMCNVYYLHATMLGMTPLSINISHGMAASDFVSSLPFVDAERLGVMGLSGGGTMALWLALCDERFKAAEVICYSDLWAYFGIRDVNYCGMQVAPGLYKLVDLPDLQGLLAPKPLLIDIGAADSCFKIDSATQCFNKLEGIYAAAGASDKLELDLYSGEHGWSGRLAGDFFDKHLGGCRS